MTQQIDISENGIVWDRETNELLGHFPTHLSVADALQVLNELRFSLARVEGVADGLRHEGRDGTADILKQAMGPLRPIRNPNPAVNERMVA